MRDGLARVFRQRLRAFDRLGLEHLSLLLIEALRFAEAPADRAEQPLERGACSRDALQA